MAKKKKRNMAKKRKESWLLKEPNLVPRSKSLRIAMFTIINAIFVSLLPILAIYINYPYGYICWVGVISPAILFNMKAFHVHTERYPLNDYSEYKFNPLADELVKKDEVFIIEIEKKRNVFEIRLKEKTLFLDMKGCIFPITVIEAYLGRQFLIEYINKYRLVIDMISKNINVSKRFGDYENIQIIYKNKRKIKKRFLIKKGKTNMTFLMRSINGYGYVTTPYIAYRKIDKRWSKIMEEEFVERKENYKK